MSQKTYVVVGFTIVYIWDGGIDNGEVVTIVGVVEYVSCYVAVNVFVGYV